MASIAVAGSIAQRPGRGGHAWVFLNYLVGLRRLGHDVVFVDRLTADMLGSKGPAVERLRRSPQARWLEAVMRGAGFEDRFFLLVGDDGHGHEETRRALLARLRETDLLLNVNGFLRDAELRAAPRVTAFVDIDPSIQQMWQELGLADVFDGHDLHFTVGENVGRPSCTVPTLGLSWLPTRQPVVIDQWPLAPPGKRFSSVATWRGPYGSIEYRGETYGLRVHEFRRLASLPSMVDADCAIALDIDAADVEDAAALRRAGWKLLDPLEAAGDPGAYRSFIQGSRAEIAIAKNVYVRSMCGWFSDRSACYLASGRPVVAQDTGFSENLPTGEGLFSFSELDGAVDGIEAASRDWSRHSRAARRLAEEHFDSDAVLGGILDAAEI